MSSPQLPPSHLNSVLVSSSKILQNASTGSRLILLISHGGYSFMCGVPIPLKTNEIMFRISRTIGGISIAAGSAAVLGTSVLPLRCNAGPTANPWIKVDFSKFPLEHHLVHASLTGDGKVEEYNLFLSPDRKSARIELRLGDKSAFSSSSFFKSVNYVWRSS